MQLLQYHVFNYIIRQLLQYQVFNYIIRQLLHILDNIFSYMIYHIVRKVNVSSCTLGGSTEVHLRCLINILADGVNLERGGGWHS